LYRCFIFALKINISLVIIIGAIFYDFRASQKLNLNGSPHRRKRRGSQGEEVVAASHGFASGLHKHAPPLPALLQRRIAGKELTGVGKVRYFNALWRSLISFLHFMRICLRQNLFLLYEKLVIFRLEQL